MLNNVNINGGMRQADNCCNQRTFLHPMCQTNTMSFWHLTRHTMWLTFMCC